MSLSNGGIKLVRRVARQVDIPTATLPAFLCPAVLHPAPFSTTYLQSRRHLHTTPHVGPEQNFLTSRPLASVLEPNLISKLPVQCPGCGAFSQVVEKDEPGFYTLSRKSVKPYFQKDPTTKGTREQEIFEDAVTNLGKLDDSQDVTDENKRIVRELSSAFAETVEPQMHSLEPPVCDRCHNLKHHQTGVPIDHPSVQSIQDTIFESPHKYNHIYHIIDAADFPMSLVPGLHKLLHLTPQRSLNRRSPSGKFFHGRKTEVSFVITRSDLLAPTKEHVNKLMPYLQSVLRDALGRVAQETRLGNVRCVSAKRQWWTKELKEEIWLRGGGGWMVGKVNVGKSQLFHEVFPKGRMGDWGRHTTVSTAMGLKSGLPAVKNAPNVTIQQPLKVQAEPTAPQRATESTDPVVIAAHGGKTDTLIKESSPAAADFSSADRDEFHGVEHEAGDLEDSSSVASEKLDKFSQTLDTNSLLPPLPSETSYPAMPLVSSLPGTTASPIRVPYGNGKGELIDLPGLSRNDLENHVQPQFRASLVMTSRVEPQQRVLKPGQSLLLGGFIRITPTTPNLHVLAYNFTGLREHQTSNVKAIGVQTRTMETNTENISIPGTEVEIASAGKFYLKNDVTKVRTGPVTRNDAGGIKIDRLPFRVLGTDILIEGVGWIELAAQVRKPHGYLEEETLDSEAMNNRGLIDPTWPEVEIFTPKGKFVGERKPMNAWVMIGNKPGARNVKVRPRKAMKGVKKVEKSRAREHRPVHPL
ncbi:Genetic interactor of prohibitin [Hyphodiscus hymeniophilus]|uniref:Genetic interactor of prohibitin n=1 Tax=Hyphodiscus hymeniophilus TaxID=353542 RepID=A0A9P6SLG4_9HELO|nr:Genetic interactor of prohibitin [Hyphodiscus hymeniophilus]